ncbi:hypothetical protein ABB55_03280 [Prosthecomicrobium hirschii]|uniref:HIRAN domain-containing protein n=1 Tax=Prosthecodimorpha hirschii TaxID=665126 RepID=A0A0P6VZZ2_9HYPH|nr:hypothetical protein [Prosthecomicrobium hirschii]KPL51368.1 hypothetical protein ABB55_03280 [Prosthecomicrobium hirschii]
MTIGTNSTDPPGEWVTTTAVVKVAGLRHHQEAFESFVAAVQRAEANAMAYGVDLEPEPTNPVDPFAIRVYGWAMRSRFLRGPARDRYFLGFVPAGLAAELHADLTDAGVPFAARLYSIWLGETGFVDVNIIILAPSGWWHKARIKMRGC